MVNFERDAQRVAKLIRFNNDTLVAVHERGGNAALGDAIGRTPAIAYIASTMSDAQFEQVLMRAFEIVGWMPKSKQ